MTVAPAIHQPIVAAGKWWAIRLLALALAALAGCADPDPIVIGFVGGLSGRVSDLGTAGRDGVILAVEEKNAAGGIGGRQIVLKIRDDRQDPETMKTVTAALFEDGAAAVIGPMTSAMAVAGVPVADRYRRVILSPTTSTIDLAERDDYFLRVYPYSRQTPRLLAEAAYRDLGLRRVSVIYDIRNRSHTEPAYQSFADTFTGLGGSVLPPHTFSSGPQVSFMTMAREVRDEEGDGLYILANAVDTALISQQLGKLHHKVQLLSSDWSATGELLHLGGHAVEGLFLMRTTDESSQEPRFLRFREQFRNRFSREPDFGAIHAYDCANILFTALDKDAAPDLLKNTILGIGTFRGIQGEIRFDAFGDVTRTHFPYTVENGAFVRKDRDR